MQTYFGIGFCDHFMTTEEKLKNTKIVKKRIRETQSWNGWMLKTNKTQRDCAVVKTEMLTLRDCHFTPNNEIQASKMHNDILDGTENTVGNTTKNSVLVMRDRSRNVRLCPTAMTQDSHI